MTTFTSLYSDFPVCLPKTFLTFLPLFVFVFISCIYLYFFVSQWLAPIAVYLFLCVLKLPQETFQKKQILTYFNV